MFDIKKIKDEYTRYMIYMAGIHQKIIENNKWYKQQQNYSDKPGTKDISDYSQSGYVFSALSNKHADAMDNYPDINILPKEQNDESEAQALSDVIPVVLEMDCFRKTFSKAWWYKLKNGTAVYGVFWDKNKINGLGDIDVRKIDILNLAWQPGITNIQESRYLFYSYYIDKSEFIGAYGEKLAEQAQQDNTAIKTYEETKDNESILIIDCYYKIKDGGKSKLHFVKFSGEAILEFTEGKAEYQDGIYEHGLYPFFFDVLYPNEDSPMGFGIIDVIRRPQSYIDKLDQIIQDAATITGRPRYWIKDSGSVNEQEFLDLKNPLVHVAGDLENSIKPMQQPNLPAIIANHRETKINELKEVIGNRDFQQGGTSGGVTAASAITILQQAGDKLSRDMVADSYAVYKEIIYAIIELIRQFYNQDRTFRITGEGGENEYITYNNQNLKLQELGAFLNPIGQMPGMGTPDNMQSGAELPSDTNTLAYRKPEFDISLSVERNNPFNKAQQNNTILQLWSAGIFNPQNIDMSIIMLQQMNFDGKDDLINSLREFKDSQQQMQQMEQQQQMQQMQQPPMQQQADEMVEIPIGGAENPINDLNDRVQRMRENTPITTGSGI